MAEIRTFSEEIIGKLNKEDIAKFIYDYAEKVGFLVIGEDASIERLEETDFRAKVDEWKNSTNNTDGSKANLAMLLNMLARRRNEDHADISNIINGLKTALELEEDDEIVNKVERLKSHHKFKLKVDKNIPKFSGSGAANENLDDWMFMIDSFEKFNDVAEEDMLGLVMPLLRGQALQMLKRGLAKNPDLLWFEFKEELIATFLTDTRERRLRKELKELKHKNSFDEFLTKFREISMQLQDIPEKEMLRIFIEAVKPRTRYELLSKNVGDLEQAMRIARIYEECHGESGQKDGRPEYDIKKVNYTKAEFPKKFKFKKKSFEFNKFKSGGKFTGETRKDFDKSKIKCFKCNKMGHMSRNCRVKTDKFHKVNQVVGIDQQNDCKNDYVGRVRTVLMVSHKHDYQLPSVQGYVNGIKMSLAFDSGATVSCMSRETAFKHGINVLPSHIKIRVADNIIREPTGETELLTVEVKGHICRDKFFVIDLPDYDVLLGMPWFLETGAGLYPKENILHFNGEKVHLDTPEKWTEECVYLTELDDEEIEDEMCWDLTKCTDKNIEVVKSEMKLKKDQMEQFNKTIKKMVELFAYDLSDLKTCNVGKHVIRTIECPPVFTPPYRKSQQERQQIKDEVEIMLKLGIIEKSSSPWNSPVIIVPKKDGTRRFVVDFRNVNSVIKNEIWPMPRIEDILDRLSGSKYFSVLDLTSGYWQIEVEESSRPITSFSTCDAHYQFTRMPFGLKCAPAEFSRIMFQVLGGRTYVEIYLDDITIHSKTLEEHFKHIELVAEALKKAQLKIKPSKCRWVCEEIKLLGHVVSGGHVAMDPDKISAVQKRVPPKNLKQVQQYLGICNYYRRFIKDYARIAEPLTRLLKAENKFEWGLEQETAFETLKQALVSYPVLRQPDMNKEFFLFTDASGYCMGAVLAQKDEEGKEHAVAYASKLLKNSELSWTVTEKECYACVWAIKKYRIYLWGSKFMVITDHSALAWLMNIKDPNGRLARWSIYLQSYRFEIIHRKGLIHSNADTLSRPVMMITPTEEEDEQSIKTREVYEDENLLHFLKTGKHFPGLPNKQVKRIEKMAEQYSIRENQVIFRKDEESEEKIVPPPDERYYVAERAHKLGHFQVDATVSRLKQNYFWKGMDDHVKKVISRCDQCIKNHKVPSLEHPAKATKVTGIFDRIGIDLTFGLTETKEGYHGLLTIVEYVSKYPWAIPIKSKCAEEISARLWEFFTQYGPSKEILSDCGGEFNNELVDGLLKKLNMSHKTTSPYSPRTNGLVERFNHLFVESLRKVVDDDVENWVDYVPFVLMAFRSKVNTSTLFTPYKLLFGRDMNNMENWNYPIDCRVCKDSMFSDTCDCHSKAIARRAGELKRLVEVDHPEAIKNIEKRQEIQKQDQNKSHRVTDQRLPVGSKVFVSTVGMNDKLFPKYRGPFTIVEHTELGNYILENQLKERMSGSFPLQRLKLVGEDYGKDQGKDAEFFRIEKILDDRKENGKIKVLIKWKGFPESQNSWEPLENLTDKDMYTAYLKKKTKPAAKPTRKSKRLEKAVVNYVWTLLSLLCLAFGVMAKPEEQVIAPVYFCEDPGEHPWDLPLLLTEKGCADWVEESKINKSVLNIDGRKLHSFVVMSRHAFEIRGVAYECKMKQVKVKTWVNFFGAPYK